MNPKSSSTVTFSKNIVTLTSNLAITPRSFIVGLVYYELGSKTINAVIPATLSSNTALVITLNQA